MVEFQLCNTEFWNLNHTWHTDKPRLSPCFRDTVLVWVPACVILFAIVVELLSWNDTRGKRFKRPASIDWNLFNITRLALTSALFLLCLSKSMLGYSNGGSTSVVSALTAPMIQTISSLCLFAIYCIHRADGRHTSASTWFYLLLALIADVLDLHSRYSTTKPEHPIDIIHVSKFATLLLMFILECRGDTALTRQSIDPDDPRQEWPRLRASFCSTILFSWYTSFLWNGYSNRLTTADLWKSCEIFRVDRLATAFQNVWNRARPAKIGGKLYQTSTGEAQPKNGICFVLYRLLRWRMLRASGLKLIQDLLQYMTPLILKYLLEFISSTDDDNNGQPEWHGIFFALMLLILPTIQTVVLNNYLVRVATIAVEVRSTIIAAVYRKSLQLSSSSRLQSTSGEIINLMSVDSNRFFDLLIDINLLWSAPLQMVITLAFLYAELGWSVLAGVAFMALVIPINLYITNNSKRAHAGMMQTKDDRIKQMNELLNGIKVVKLYAWEDSFIANLFGFRNKELEYLERILFLDAVQSFVWQCMPFIVSLMTFALYVLSDETNVLTAEKAFVSLALFNLLKYPLIFLPAILTRLVTTLVSAKRLNRFLNNDELVRYVTRNEHPEEAITIESGTLSWSKEPDDQMETDEGSDNISSKLEERPPDKNAILKDINIHVKRNSFVAIVGQVASGKSSLLSAMLGEMHRIAGRFNICQSMSIAYVPQQAWIQNMTIKGNILFGLPLDEEKYRRILSVCALDSDLAIVPGGDRAEIGENGINLSGGQKQRVSLARACYSDSDLYLFDDPLSALDSHVAKHVFDEVLSSSTGLLKDKTRVLATNSLFVLPHVDHIIVLDKGRIVESGTYKKLTANQGGYLRDVMIKYSGNNQPNPDADDKPEKKATLEPLSELRCDNHTNDVVVVPIEQRNPQIDDTDRGRLIQNETAETGSVDFRVYWAYVLAFSKHLMLITVITSAASSGFNVITNIWLAIWTSDSESSPLDSDDDSEFPGQNTSLKLMRLLVFAALGAIQCLVVLVCTLVLSHGAVRASRRLHHELLTRILHSPMSFFDTTPMGRIVNRFAKDIDVIDLTLPCTLRSWLNCVMPIISTIILICNSFPSFLIILLPLAVVYWLVQRVFIVTTRQLKRLESTTRSPIYSQFSETLSGMSTIRAYDSVDRFVRLSDNLVERNQSCTYPNVMAFRWLAIRLEFLANIMSMSVALLSVYYRSAVGAGVAGLMISYTLSITTSLAWLIRMSSDLENDIVSVERILEYVKNQQEDLWIKEDQRPAVQWPARGAIEIRDYSTRYRDETDLVLRDLNIDIKPGEKIGIVGRTGSGKSSLSLSLFRILEPASGRIMIDQLDIVKYGLHDVRSKLTIIPQDPVLFSGTLRFNLDPLQLYMDCEIWRALELAHLKNSIGTLTFGLDYKVSEYGKNFSVGQRQLICLARAILRKSKILILDEATASVDLETDSIVQKTIRDIFNDCTIITIAHRLHTILDSDRILVLDKGYVKELDSPESLVLDPNSAFSSLVRDAGIEIDNVLQLAATRRKRE